MEKVENLSQRRKNEPHRVIKDMSHTGLKTNSPDDFFDYRYSYYCKETSERVEGAVEKFFTELAEILDNDRAMAKQKEAAQAVGEGKPTQQER